MHMFSRYTNKTIPLTLHKPQRHEDGKFHSHHHQRDPRPNLEVTPQKYQEMFQIHLKRRDEISTHHLRPTRRITTSSFQWTSISVASCLVRDWPQLAGNLRPSPSAHKNMTTIAGERYSNQLETSLNYLHGCPYRGSPAMIRRMAREHLL